MSVANSEITSEPSASTTTTSEVTTQDILDTTTEIFPSLETDTETITLLPTSLDLGIQLTISAWITCLSY